MKHHINLKLMQGRKKLKNLFIALFATFFIVSCGEIPLDIGPWSISSDVDEMTGTTMHAAQLVREIQGGYAFVELACTGAPNESRYQVLTQTTTSPDTALAMEIKQSTFPAGFEEIQNLMLLGNPAGFFNLTLRVDDRAAEEIEHFPRKYSNGFEITKATEDIELSSLLNADKFLLRFTTLSNNFSTENTISVDQSGSSIRQFIQANCGVDTASAPAASDDGNGSSQSNVSIDIDFGDDSGIYASDGECDDPRFEGSGMSWLPAVEENIKKDATDCRNTFNAGQITIRGRS